MVNKTYLIAFVVALSTIALTISDHDDDAVGPIIEDLANCDTLCKSAHIYQRGLLIIGSVSNCLCELKYYVYETIPLTRAFDWKEMNEMTKFTDTQSCNLICRDHIIDPTANAFGVYFTNKTFKNGGCACFENTDRTIKMLKCSEDFRTNPDKSDREQEKECRSDCQTIKKKKHFGVYVSRVFLNDSTACLQIQNCECYDYTKANVQLKFVQRGFKRSVPK